MSADEADESSTMAEVSAEAASMQTDPFMGQPLMGAGNRRFSGFAETEIDFQTKQARKVTKIVTAVCILVGLVLCIVGCVIKKGGAKVPLMIVGIVIIALTVMVGGGLIMPA